MLTVLIKQIILYLDTDCGHQSGGRSEDVSLNSFNTNGYKKSMNGSNTLNFTGSKVMYEKGSSVESEPLYEQTTAIGNMTHQKMTNYHQQQQQLNKSSPLHCKMNTIQQGKQHYQQSNENLLDCQADQHLAQIPLMSNNCESAYSYMQLCDNNQMFEHRPNPTQFKTLGRVPSNTNSHLYQMPEPVKSDPNAIMTLKRDLDNQDQAKLGNNFMTTFGMRRPTDPFQ